jgi:TolB protein
VYSDSPQFPPLDYEIYVVDLAESGGEAKRLIIHSAGADYYPAFSPDGGHLAYSGARDFISKFDLWVTDLRSKPAVITNHRAYTSFVPVWSPDGKWLAYSVIHDGEWEVFRIRSDGSDQQQLTEIPGGEGEETFTDWGNRNPAWSSDGSQIAFVSNLDRNDEIYVMEADGSGQTNLTNDGADDTNPAWQP